MPTTEFNKQHWGTGYRWPKQGDEWSNPWGGSEAQWYMAILPRIHAFVPARNILEIAPGFGRWTHYLKDLCQNLTIVDLNQNCIERCKERFSSSTNITYYTNDGTSLEMIADGAIDFAFSFDSLVHAEIDVLESYVNQLAVKLSRDGVGFFHHSNLGEYRRRWRYQGRIPRGIKRFLTERKILNYYHMRSLSVTAARFQELCDSAGLCCISQEMVNWRQRLLIDSFSVFTRKQSKWARPNAVLRNDSFSKETSNIWKLSRLYSFGFREDPIRLPLIANDTKTRNFASRRA